MVRKYQKNCPRTIRATVPQLSLKVNEIILKYGKNHFMYMKFNSDTTIDLIYLMWESYPFIYVFIRVSKRILQDGTRLLWGLGNRLRLLYKLRIRVGNTKNKK